jgi:hypothetical protein
VKIADIQGAFDLAVDDKSVYWTDNNGGQVLRLDK